jgi:hypothetical protein
MRWGGLEPPRLAAHGPQQCGLSNGSIITLIASQGGICDADKFVPCDIRETSVMIY